MSSQLLSSKEISPVVLQAGALSELDKHLPSLANYSQLIVLSHPQLMHLYGPSVLSALKRLNRPILELMIPEGEGTKSLNQSKLCWKTMFANGVDRYAAVIALGGGVVCDFAGFVASCYMRGLDTFYLPTTLLAMVDAALGGKTGVNFSKLKNAIGTFHLPQYVVIDSTCLKTLPQREFNSGLAEIIKYGMISDPLLVDKLENEVEAILNRKEECLETIIQRCVILKNQIVAEDPKDMSGRRATLNYGHTVGHAIEAVTGYHHYLHGEAIAMGMSCAAHLSVELALCPPSLIERQDRLCQCFDLPTQLPKLSITHLIKRMKGDKKGSYGKINLILLKEIGQVVKVSDVEPALIKHVLSIKMCDTKL